MQLPSYTEDEIDATALAGLRSHILSIGALEFLVKQQCFALDALSLIGQTIDRMEGRI